MKNCAACKHPFKLGDKVQRVPPLEEIRKGAKSGELGTYSIDNISPIDHDLLHNSHGCYETYFSPMENPFLYDGIAQEVYSELEGQLREEIKDELSAQFEQVKEMIAEGNHNFCVDCWAMVEEDKPPTCLWCESPDAVWMHQKKQGMIFWCSRCNRSWNDQDIEISLR